MDFNLAPKAQEIGARVDAFFDAEILPRHRDWGQAVVREGRDAPFMDALRAKARAAGLWNLALADLPQDAPGTRLSNLEFAGVAETLGRLPWASQIMNCQAPDVPSVQWMASTSRAPAPKSRV